MRLKAQRTAPPHAVPVSAPQPIRLRTRVDPSEIDPDGRIPLRVCLLSGEPQTAAQRRLQSRFRACLGLTGQQPGQPLEIDTRRHLDTVPLQRGYKLQRSTGTDSVSACAVSSAGPAIPLPVPIGGRTDLMPTRASVITLQLFDPPPMTVMNVGKRKPPWPSIPTRAVEYERDSGGAVTVPLS